MSSLLSALQGIVRRRSDAPRTVHRRPGRPRQRWRLALEVLEDRLCLSGNLLVSSFYSNQIFDYDGTQGTFLRTFASSNNTLVTPVGLALGPNGDVFVSGRSSNNVVRYDGNTGAFLGTFVAPGSGGLNWPHQLTFGPDGSLYVASALNSSVVRYDGQSGAFLSTFVTPGSGGLNFPHGLTFGPDGNLYVGDTYTNRVLRYNGTTGAFIDVFVPAGSSPLSATTGLTFGPDGNLYVDSFNTSSVLRYDGKTGAFLGTFASGGGLSGPQGLAFGPDGNLYVSSFNTNQIVRYNGTTGAFIDIFAGAGGLGGPTYLLFRRTNTTTTVSASANPLVFGQSASFTATVSGVVATPSLPTGTVTFTIDGIAQAPIALSNGQATLSTATLSVGSHLITAAYSGDIGFSSSASTPLTETVNKDSTMTAVRTSVEPAVFGQPVTFTASVSVAAPGAGSPSGTVTFNVDGTAQTPVPLSNGSATLTTAALGVGSHTITAIYNGDGNDNSSSATITQNVNPASTTTTLAAPASAIFGQLLTFTAAVGVAAPGAGTPSGLVTFTIDGAVQTPVPLSNRQATFSTSALGVGGHTITATYAGDSNFTTSTSAPLSQTVNQADTTTTIAASANPSVFGQALAWVATVTPVAPGAGLPTGTITFTIDGVAQPSALLSNGQASLTSAALSVGSHTISAVYNGDGNFNASSSAALSQTVNQADTAIAFNAAPNPSVFGQPVTFTAVVSAVAPGAGLPTGTVTFSIDGTAQTPSLLSNGQATFTTATLRAGLHEISMVYSGDGNFNSSTLDPLLTVVKADTATTLSASSAPTVFGQPVTFTASVGVVAPGAGTPTGTVTFWVDGTAQTPVPLSNGQAAFTTATLGVGNHTVTAAYSGDGNFNSSTSGPWNQTVNRADTAIAFSVSAAPPVFGQTVTFTAVVAVAAPGAGTPTGTVVFSIDGTAQVSVPVSNGQATFSTSTLRAGTHEISMVYSGDGNFNSTTLDPTVTVIKADTTTTLSASAAATLFGQPVTFTASVGVVAPGAGTPTGTVTFWVDGTAQTPVPLSNGQAAFTTATLGVGNHTVTAAYSGDGNFNPSTSAALNHTVNQAGASLVLGSSASPAVFGQRVTFTATVVGFSQGANPPTGKVVFIVDGKVQEPVPLRHGQAIFTTSKLSVGSHTITARYGTILSAPLNQVVKKDSTTTVVHTSPASSVWSHWVTFTVTVRAMKPGGGTPQGTVTFSVDGQVQATVTLVNGKARFSTTKLAVGKHVIIVTYNGDANFVGSTSTPVVLRVKPHGQKEDHDRDRKEDPDRDDAPPQHFPGDSRGARDAGKDGAGWADHSDLLAQRIRALKARILRRRRTAGDASVPSLVL